MDMEKKQVLVFGTGVSGIGAADLLLEKGAEVLLYDGNDKQDPEQILAKLRKREGARVILGALPEDALENLDLAILSPGVPTDLPDVLRIKEKVPVWGEVELAWQTGQGTVLAITGTNGKTTTTALLGQIMADARDSVYVVGNIGTPYTSVALETGPDTVTVAEISSFQLETIHTFHPRVSAILNITEDHLNRHHTMAEYIRVKEQICRNQTKEDTVVLNYEDEVLREFGKTAPASVIYFSSKRELPEGIFLRGETIVLSVDGREIPILGTDEMHLLGRHNHENVMAAVAMAWRSGVPVDSIRNSVRNFHAVEHRIEYVTEKNGVTYYNDSKGTNPDAAIKGIRAMNRPTWLIGGGYDKDSSYEEWIRAFDGKVRGLVLIGQTKEKIAEAAHGCGFMNTILADDLEEAVQICAEHALVGEAVLLSPACASWGQFPNYEVRGKKFKEYVGRL
ncbi:MAG TPA: UDP-N-acetylmuramoyl-L-alanine--D-glutamate ligase [Lachnospiraceae bacterium]|nr:UDP-N-acetylmuramoyl-L-alanine--D-glutamate ligase [Lachnospiraceae bacterium]